MRRSEIDPKDSELSFRKLTLLLLDRTDTADCVSLCSVALFLWNWAPNGWAIETVASIRVPCKSQLDRSTPVGVFPAPICFARLVYSSCSSLVATSTSPRLPPSSISKSGVGDLDVR